MQNSCLAQVFPKLPFDRRIDTCFGRVGVARSAAGVSIPVRVCADAAPHDTTADGKGSHGKQFSLPVTL